MTGTIRATANDILNQVGAELGLDPVNDPFASSDQSYRQLRYLINTAGEELSQLHPWEFLRKEQQIASNGDESYPLAADFLYLINQTVWDRTNDQRVMGPLNPQDWAFVKGGNLMGSTLAYAFRLMDDKIAFYPTPTGVTFSLEYIGRNWVLDSTTGNTYIDKIQEGADQPLFNRTLLGRMTRVKFLESKGFDTTKAQADLDQAFSMLIARNKAAPVLSTKPGRRDYPYLNSGNIPETGFGS